METMKSMDTLHDFTLPKAPTGASISGKSMKSTISVPQKPTKDGAIVVGHDQVYREIFDAEVQLARSIEATRYQRAHKPPPEPDTSTKKTHLPAVSNLPPGGPQNGLLTQKGSYWTHLLPNDMHGENPVLAKQRKRAQQLLDRGRGPDVDEMAREVQDLPNNLTATKLNSDIIDRVTEKRLAKHNALLEEMHQQLSMLNQAMEPRVEKECTEITNQMTETRTRVSEILQQIGEDQQLITMQHADILRIWNAVLLECEDITRKVDATDERLHTLETERVASLRKALGQYSDIMERVSHLSPGDLHKVIDDELLTLNQSLISNQRDLADLKARLLLTCINMEKDSRVAWENRVAKWKELHTDIAKDDFRRFMSAENIQSPPEIDSLIQQLQEEQSVLNQKRIEKLRQLQDDFIPPKTTKQFVYDWNQTILNLSKELDGVNQKYVKLIYQQFENVTQRCLDKMKSMQENLLQRSVCTEEEANQLLKEFCLPFIGSVQTIYEKRMERMDKDFEKQNKQTAQHLKNLFKFLLGVGHLWDKHEVCLESQEKKLQEKLATARQNHSQHNQDKETQLDVLMDRMRQEATEEGLKEVLKKALDLLEKLKASYVQFHTHQVHFVKGYPGMVLTEVESYEKMMTKYFGCKKEKPPVEDKATTKSSAKSGAHSSRSSQHHHPAQASGGTRRGVSQSSTESPHRHASPTKTTEETAEPPSAPPQQPEAEVNSKVDQSPLTKRKSFKGKKGKAAEQAAKKPPAEFIVTERGTRYIIKYDAQGNILRSKEKDKNEKDKDKADSSLSGLGSSSGGQLSGRISVHVGFILPLPADATTGEEQLAPHVKEMLLSEAQIREIKINLRRRLISHLEDWHEEALQKSRRIVAAKTDELDSELQLRLHLHEPRTRRAEMDVHNVRAAELILHSERVTRHCKGVTQTLTEMKQQLTSLQEQHSTWESQFKARLEEMDDTFSNATKSSKIANMSNKLNSEVAIFMEKIRSSLQKFRQNVDDKLQMLREANSNFIRSFKLFSEGGNFCPEEVEEFRKRLEKVAHKIEQNEAAVISELEGMEKRRQDSAINFSKSFEERFKNNLLDLVFVEKMTRWFTNTQLNIKSEVSDSNSQTRRLLDYIQLIEARIDAVRLPTVDKEKITAVELSRSLLETFQAFHDRAIYLNCVKTQVRPASPPKDGGREGGTGMRVGFVPQPTPISKPGKLALDDPSIAVIRGILTTQKMRASTNGLPESSGDGMDSTRPPLVGKKGEAGSSQLLTNSSQHAAHVSSSNLGAGSASNFVQDASSVAATSAAVFVQDSRRNSNTTDVAPTGAGKGGRSNSAKNKYVAKNQRLDKKYLIFGEGEVSLAESQHFLGRIKETCRVALDGMLFVAEVYYRTKGARPVTRPQVMHATFDLCAEAVTKKLQSFFQQAEAYHNTCLKEFRNQLVKLECLVLEVPPLVLDEGYFRIIKNCQAKMDNLKQVYRLKMGDLEAERLRLENLLRPDLGHPQKAQELSSVVQQLSERHESVQRVIQEHRTACETVLLAAGREFVAMISAQSEQLLLQFDNLLTADEVDSGRFDPVRYPTTELLRRKYHGEALNDDENATLIPRGKHTWPSIDMSEFLVLPEPGSAEGATSSSTTLQSKSSSVPVGGASSATVITAKTTMAHNATEQGRDNCMKKFREVFHKYVDNIRELHNKDTIMENRWHQSLHKSVESITKLYA